MKQLGKVPVLSWVSVKDGIDVNSIDPVDGVLRQIQKRLEKYSERFGECWRYIYINTVSVDDHKPTLLSIGPNYWDTIKPDVMEVHKLKYLKDYVERIDTNVEELVRANLQAFKRIERELLGYRSIDAFVEMCIIDGCFIIELFMKNYCSVPFRVPDDPLFKAKWVLESLRRDLIRPNNQLPFEVLNTLGKHVKHWPGLGIEKHDHFKMVVELALCFLSPIVPNQRLEISSFHQENKKTDLLGIVYDGLDWQYTPGESYCDCCINDTHETQFEPKSATELEEYGVKLQVERQEDNQWNLACITFRSDGVLRIPKMCFRRGTPYSIKVLLAYENNHPEYRYQHRYLNDYILFINFLVKSPSDVQLLRQREIIDNLSELLDDTAIYKFLKDMYAYQIITLNHIDYIRVSLELVEYCEHRRNRWMAKLKRDYFNSPWAFISFFAASLLLIFACVQTVFSIASYYK